MDIFNIDIPDFSLPGVWISLLTLLFLEIVLGIDNIIFISIISNKLPESKQKSTRNIGLIFAMVFRVILLLMINWIIGLKKIIFSTDLIGYQIDFSWKDLILLAGGIFLIFKSTLEIHHKMMEPLPYNKEKKPKVSGMVTSVIIQIIMIDLVFSLDSILTAVGLVKEVFLMIVAVVFAIIVMMLFSGYISRVINKHPSLQMLALSFLVVIGVLLVAEGIHQHISKNIVYSCLFFSLIVELLNIQFRNKQEKAHKVYSDDELKDL